jgi:hypothetical protein
VFSSALSNSGLGFLNTVNPTNSISNGAEAKVMTVSDCVLTNVTVDYAPNGWAAYNDGYPIQTSLTLQFTELEMPTKNSIKNSKVASNYNYQQDVAQYGQMGADGLAAAAKSEAGGIGWVSGGG